MDTARSQTWEARAPRDDDELLEALASGNERVFADLVREWGGVMLRVALAHVDSRAVAEEVVQDAWLTVLRRLAGFERRSAFRTWVLGIVVNLARSRARAERRALPVPPTLAQPAVARTRFLPAGARWAGHWARSPVPWPTPEDELLAAEARRVILDAVSALPPAQREVVVLRDLAGLAAEETCNILGLTDTNQRVLLHRARSRVRDAIERYFDGTGRT